MQTLRFTLVSDSTARTVPWAPDAPAGQPAPQPARAGLISLAQTAWRRYRSRTLLAQLDDYMLKDIGVTRAEAHLEASKPFWTP
ncbi:MAG TPA: DUF1127 domain-containing protein [Acetobacteraceae bacterium]